MGRSTDVSPLGGGECPLSRSTERTGILTIGPRARLCGHKVKCEIESRLQMDTGDRVSGHQ